MKNSSITGFLKAAAVLLLAQGAIGTLLSAIALCVLPALSDATPLSWLSGIASLVSSAVFAVFAALALKHRSLSAGYKAVLFVMLFSEAVNAIGMSGIEDYIDLVISVVIPLLFLVACHKQLKLDRDGQGR